MRSLWRFACAANCCREPAHDGPARGGTFAAALGTARVLLDFSAESRDELGDVGGGCGAPYSALACLRRLPAGRGDVVTDYKSRAKTYVSHPTRRASCCRAAPTDPLWCASGFGRWWRYPGGAERALWFTRPFFPGHAKSSVFAQPLPARRRMRSALHRPVEGDATPDEAATTKPWRRRRNERRVAAGGNHAPRPPRPRPRPPPPSSRSRSSPRRSSRKGPSSLRPVAWQPTQLRYSRIPSFTCSARISRASWQA